MKNELVVQVMDDVVIEDDQTSLYVVDFVLGPKGQI